MLRVLRALRAACCLIYVLVAAATRASLSKWRAAFTLASIFYLKMCMAKCNGRTGAATNRRARSRTSMQNGASRLAY